MLVNYTLENLLSQYDCLVVVEPDRAEQRMQARRQYIIQQLGIQLSEDVLPMCGTVAYLRPYLLDKELAFVIR